VAGLARLINCRDETSIQFVSLYVCGIRLLIGLNDQAYSYLGSLLDLLSSTGVRPH